MRCDTHELSCFRSTSIGSPLLPSCLGYALGSPRPRGLSKTTILQLKIFRRYLISLYLRDVMKKDGHHHMTFHLHRGMKAGWMMRMSRDGRGRHLTQSTNISKRHQLAQKRSITELIRVIWSQQVPISIFPGSLGGEIHNRYTYVSQCSLKPQRLLNY